MLSALLERMGTVAMVRLAVVLALFVAAHLARLPLLWTVRVLTAAMCRADRYLTGCLAAAANTPTPSIRIGGH